MINQKTSVALLLIIAILTLSYNVKVKPREVFVEEEIGSSTFTGEVVITGDDGKGNIQFKSTVYSDTISSACCSFELKDAYHASYDLTNNHPDDGYLYVGDTVFIVVTGRGAITIVGKRVGNDYRLSMAGKPYGATLFEFYEPIKTVDGTDNWGKEFGMKGRSSMNACLMPIDLAPGLIQQYRQQFKNELDSFPFTKLIGQPAYWAFYEGPLRYYSRVTWKIDAHQKLTCFTFHFSTGRALEVYPVNKRNKSVFVDTTKVFDWTSEFSKLKIKEVRRRD